MVKICVCVYWYPSMIIEIWLQAHECSALCVYRYDQQIMTITSVKRWKTEWWNGISPNIQGPQVVTTMGYTSCDFQCNSWKRNALPLTIISFSRHRSQCTSIWIIPKSITLIDLHHKHVIGSLLCGQIIFTTYKKGFESVTDKNAEQHAFYYLSSSRIIVNYMRLKSTRFITTTSDIVEIQAGLVICT